VGATFASDSRRRESDAQFSRKCFASAQMFGECCANVWWMLRKCFVNVAQMFREPGACVTQMLRTKFAYDVRHDASHVARTCRARTAQWARDVTFGPLCTCCSNKAVICLRTCIPSIPGVFFNPKIVNFIYRYAYYLFIELNHIVRECSCFNSWFHSNESVWRQTYGTRSPKRLILCAV
jgi:hypothetical protein